MGDGLVGGCWCRLVLLIYWDFQDTATISRVFQEMVNPSMERGEAWGEGRGACRIVDAKGQRSEWVGDHSEATGTEIMVSGFKSASLNETWTHPGTGDTCLLMWPRPNATSAIMDSLTGDGADRGCGRGFWNSHPASLYIKMRYVRRSVKFSVCLSRSEHICRADLHWEIRLKGRPVSTSP